MTTSRTLRAHGTPVLTTWLVRYTVSKRAPGGVWAVVREGEVAADAHTPAQATMLAERYLESKVAIERANDRARGEWVVVTGGPRQVTRIRASDFDETPLVETLTSLGTDGNRVAESLGRILAEAEAQGYGYAIERDVLAIAVAVDR